MEAPGGKFFLKGKTVVGLKSSMKFQKVGSSRQLVLEEPEDLESVCALDEAHWAATSAPVESFSCDPAFLKFLDSNGDGRVQSGDVKEALRWLFRMLADRRGVSDMSDVMPLDALDASHDDGRALRGAAEQVLTDFGRAGAREISLSDVRERIRVFNAGLYNGDGIIPPERIGEPELAEFARDIAACAGSAKDASGAEGIGAAQLEGFLAEAGARLEWLGGAAAIRERWAGISGGGDGAIEAFAAAAAVEEKLDQYFALCWLEKGREGAGDAGAGSGGEAYGRGSGVASAGRIADDPFRGLDATPIYSGDRAARESWLKAAPVARPRTDGRLDLTAPLNPLFRDALETFAVKFLDRAFGGSGRILDRAAWERIRADLAAYRAWLSGEKGAALAKLGEEKLRRYMSGDLPARLRDLIEKDKAASRELDRLRELEKLLLYRKWLWEFANNFVSLARLYDPEKSSLVEAGVLVMDGRRFNLTIRVFDPNGHKRIAARSSVCLLYLDVCRGSGEKFQAVASVTSGATSRMFVGKRGVLFTPDGKEWDAQVTDIITNPVDFWEAMKLPFTRVAEFAGKQIEKLSGTATANIESRASTEISAAQKAQLPPVEARSAAGGAQPSPAAAQSAPPAQAVASQARPDAAKSGAARDLLMGGGIAVAAIGSAIAFITHMLSSVSWLTLLAVLVALFLVVAIPTIILAIIKLRRRDIALILEASGWAVNASLKIRGRAGSLFTEIPPLPKGSIWRREDIVSSFISRLPTPPAAPGGGAGRKVALRVLAVLAAAAAGLLIGWLLSRHVLPPVL